MSKLEKENINERRELNQISLDTFLFDKENILDFPIDKLIKQLKLDVEKNHKELSKLADLYINNRELYDKKQETFENNGTSIREYEYHCIQEMQYLEDEEFVLLEVKIIYAYKHLEINLKKLLSSAYNDKNAMKLYNWREFTQYLLSKNIDIKTVCGYIQVNQLREVNNSLKHSSEISNETVKGIVEFKNKNSFETKDLEDFYTRIKNSPKIFIQDLVIKISENLYKFDSVRLKEISNMFALRMNQKAAEEFCANLLNHYK